MTKLKLEEEYSHLKLFMRVRFILRLLLMLLVSILFSVAVIFLWLQIVEVYYEEKQFAPVIVFSKKDCPWAWKLVEYTFNLRPIYAKTFIAKEANKI